jgi:hypothetical protein
MVRMDVSVRPAGVDSGDSDRGWYATLSGISGDAVGLPRGDQPNWGAQLLTPGTNAAGGTQGLSTTSPPPAQPAPVTPPRFR